jgi:hypothetical protein
MFTLDSKGLWELMVLNALVEGANWNNTGQCLHNIHKCLSITFFQRCQSGHLRIVERSSNCNASCLKQSVKVLVSNREVPVTILTLFQTSFVRVLI